MSKFKTSSPGRNSGIERHSCQKHKSLVQIDPQSQEIGIQQIKNQKFKLILRINLQLKGLAKI